MSNNNHRVYYLNKYEYITLTTILIIGIFVRFYKINNPVADWHSFRQADTASVSNIYFNEGINLLYPRYHDISTTQSGLFNPQGFRFVEFPVFNLLNVSFFRIYPGITIDVSGRFISILSSLISAIIIYFIGKRFISKKGGLLASFFYLILPFNIYFTRVILPEPLAVTLGLTGLYFFVKFIDFEKNKYILSSSIFFSLALLVKPYTVFYGIPAIYLILNKYGLKECFRKSQFVIMIFITFTPFILWRFWMRQFPEGIPFWKWTFNGDDIRFKPSFFRWIFGERLTKLILGYWGLVVFAFGILQESVYKKKYRFFNYSFLLGMIFYVTLIATANVRHDYYQTIAMPAIVLVLAQGVLFLWTNKIFSVLISKAVLLFSLIIMMITSAYEVREFYKINRPEIIQAGNAVNRLTEKNSLVIAAYNGDTAFLYQTGRIGWPVVDRPIDELIEKGAEYYVSVDLNHPQTREFMERFKVIEKTADYVVVDLNK